MSETNHNDPSHEEMTPEERQASLSAAVEDRDVRARGVFLAGVAILILVMASFAIPVILVTLLTGPDDPGRQAQAVPQSTPQLPSVPRLQVNEYADWETVKTEQTRRLQEYGYADEARSRARIPINRAMDILVKSGTIKVRPGGESMNIDREGFVEPEAAEWSSGHDIQSGR